MTDENDWFERALTGEDDAGDSATGTDDAPADDAGGSAADVENSSDDADRDGDTPDDGAD